MDPPAPSADRWIYRVLDSWVNERRDGQFTANVTTLPEPARTEPMPSWLHPDVVQGLRSSGIAAPYAHQVQAWQALARRQNVVIATPTASGKTLCYTVPVADSLARNPAARALLLFPTKALSRDQESAIRAQLASSRIPAQVATYDGDTSAEHRRGIRQAARVLITNPDMLHTGILPHHAMWANFFANLTHIIVDEIHYYRGVFGAHVANLFRRLSRVARFHGAAPRYVACSATIANPLQHAQTVIGEPVKLIDDSGAPTGPKTFLVFNPAVIDPVRQIRGSALKTASRLARDLIGREVTTLVFCQTRRQVELVLRYLQVELKKRGKDPKQVRGYRGGYLPTLRREIESALKNRELTGVVATNALELGIDVGALDAVVMNGYPGTIAALRQRAGRAGRRQHASLAVLVTTGDPLDQFLAHRPGYLLNSSPERALVEPDNLEILLAHARCAAFELPFSSGDAFGTLGVADTQATLDCLVEEGDLVNSHDRYHYVQSAYPAAQISLRQIGAERIAVIDQDSQIPLAEVDLRAARLELHEQAVYQHEGQTYAVKKLDLSENKAFVEATSPAYYTSPLKHVSLSVLETRGSRPLAQGQLSLGEVQVSEEITGFKKIKFHTHENLGYGMVSLPPMKMDTTATWLEPGPTVAAGLARFGSGALLSGLAGLAHVVHHVSALHLMCDPRDICTSVQAGPGNDIKPTPTDEGSVPDERAILYLYDAHQGGVGLSDRLFEEIGLVLTDAYELIDRCACTRGCPSCVGPVTDEDPPLRAIAQAMITHFTDPSLHLVQ